MSDTGTETKVKRRKVAEVYVGGHADIDIKVVGRNRVRIRVTEPIPVDQRPSEGDTPNDDIQRGSRVAG